MEPARPDKDFKLHLGCGARYLPGWYHIDALEYEHIDEIGPVDRLDSFASGTVSQIYACHVLEHFGRYEYSSVLTEWARVLKPGGVLWLAVPDFQAVARRYAKTRDIHEILGLVVGGQRDIYDFHKIIFDIHNLTETLQQVGFTSVNRYDWRDFLGKDFDDYSRAYLPHLDFEKGQLMSLNVRAIRK